MRHFARVIAFGLVLLPPHIAAQDQTVPVPAGIKVDGIPPLPQSIADTYAQYAQFRQASLLAWHPTKRQMIVGTTLGTAPQLYLVDGPGRDRHQLTWFRGG